ncbi:MAG TPA: hypothetical protein VEU08_04945 [Vicinamibacterales bacterium]|nr:hypothetical protein [Vicinamibacterales bacterium]
MALWSVLAAVIVFTRTDPDLWGHVRFGLDVLRDHALPRGDPYSFTSDLPWINHEWLAETLSAAAFSFLGPSGLVLLKAAVVGGALLLVNAALCADGVSSPRSRDWLSALTVVTTVQQAHHLRPQIFSLLLFALLLTLLMAAATSRRPMWLAGIPLVFGVWANVHGGWIVGGGVLVVWLIGTGVTTAKGRRDSTLLACVGFAALAATLLNPYGSGLWRFLFETVGVKRAEITEWQPVYRLDPTVWGLWLLTAAVASAALFRRRRSLDARRLLVVLTLAAASFFVSRLLGFFALGTVMLLGSALIRAGAADTAREATPAARRMALAVAAVMIAAAAAATGVNAACLSIDARTAPEPDAERVLKSQSDGSRLLVWFDWGEYAIWHLSPAMRVSVDGRRETVYSASVQDRHLRFFFDAPGAGDLPREIGADYVWIPAWVPAARRLRSSPWTVLYDGPTSVIFARPGLRLNRTAPAAPASSRRCFPGA